MKFRALAGLGLLLVSGTAAWAQQYVISTIAGGAPPPTPIAAVNASIGLTYGVATDAAGNVYFTSDNCVFRLEQQNGVLTRVAGNSRAGYSGDGGPAINAQLSDPRGVAVDGAGNLFFVDFGNSRIREVSSSGIITTVAGSGSAYPGDGGPATSAQLLGPQGVAVDGDGNLFIADTMAYTFSLSIRYNSRIRKVSANGIITTVAGNGTYGFSGDGGRAIIAQLLGAQGVALDSAGNIFITDSPRIRKISSSGIITTVAGDGGYGYSGDGGPAINARLYASAGVAVDRAGNVFFADGYNNRIRKVSSDGIVSTVAGNGSPGYSGDGGQAINAQLTLPGGVAVDGAGNVYFADPTNHAIRRLQPVVSSPTYPFTVTDRGGTSLMSAGIPASISVGYARVQGDAGSTTPSGLAIF